MLILMLRVLGKGEEVRSVKENFGVKVKGRSYLTMPVHLLLSL